MGLEVMVNHLVNMVSISLPSLLITCIHNMCSLSGEMEQEMILIECTVLAGGLVAGTGGDPAPGKYGKSLMVFRLYGLPLSREV